MNKLEENLKAIFSVSFFTPFFLAALGGISSVYTLFFALDDKIPGPWLVVISAVLVGIIAVVYKSYLLTMEDNVKLRRECERLNSGGPVPLFEIPIQGIPREDSLIFIIKKNIIFTDGMLVSIYLKDRGVETLLNYGEVLHQQEDITQIRMNIPDGTKLTKDAVLTDVAQIVIRPFLKSSHLNLNGA